MAVPASRRLSRRALLGAGVGVAGAAVGVGWYEASDGSAPPLTVGRWAASRGDRYFVGHRGSGDVRPEHTIEAYDAARHWGADAIEVSTSSTSDGVLICMHDLSYDRTTNATGTIHDIPSSALGKIGVRQPQLGPAWTTPPLPKVPLLEQVVSRFGSQVVLCIEPKRDADYAAVIALVERRGLRDCVIVKLFHTSANIENAKAGGYPIFAYLGPSDVSEDSISAVAARLDKTRDYLGIPSSKTQNEEYLPRSLVSAAVDTGVPVWVYPIHRRSQADRYFGLGVGGAVSSSVGYSRHALPPASSDSWRSGAIASGEMTRDPARLAYAPKWAAGGVLTLAALESQHFITLGQFSPLARAHSTYSIEFDARWNVLPTDPQANMALAFGHADDRYYELNRGTSNGYLATLRADGALQLSSHSAGSPTETPLANAATGSLAAGHWMSFHLYVTRTTLTWKRVDTQPSTTVTLADTRFRGGYVHLGRASADGSLSFRNLRRR